MTRHILLATPRRASRPRRSILQVDAAADRRESDCLTCRSNGSKSQIALSLLPSRSFLSLAASTPAGEIISVSAAATLSMLRTTRCQSRSPCSEAFECLEVTIATSERKPSQELWSVLVVWSAPGFRDAWTGLFCQPRKRRKVTCAHDRPSSLLPLTCLSLDLSRPRGRKSDR
jgi:hypothetical protein